MPDIAWLRPDGIADAARGLGLRLRPRGRRVPQRRGIRERDRRGEPIADKHFIVLFNAGDDVMDFHIPAIEYSPKWDVLVDTAGERADTEPLEPGSTVVGCTRKALHRARRSTTCPSPRSTTPSRRRSPATGADSDDMPGPLSEGRAWSTSR